MLMGTSLFRAYLEGEHPLLDFVFGPSAEAGDHLPGVDIQLTRKTHGPALFSTGSPARAATDVCGAPRLVASGAPT